MMTIDELVKIVADGESEQVEFKRSTSSLSDGIKTVCAMLNNSRSGHLCFGVNDRGELLGQDVTARTIEEIANELRKIEPAVFPAIEMITLPNSRQVINLQIPASYRVHRYDGRPYHRLGPTTSVMPHDMFARRLMEEYQADNRWERQPAEGFTIDDLDKQEILRTVDEAIRRQRLEDPGTRNPHDLLVGMGLVEDGRVLNAAVVLFGRSDRMLTRFPQCLLRLARFRGVTRTEFIDNRQESGNAFELFVRGQRFLRDHLPVAGRIVPHLFERIDDPLYPTEVLREAIANALCHRDYLSIGGSIGIAIYDDRLEIGSPGGLPFGQTPEDLVRPHPSRPRNPLIAHAFYRRGIIDEWGRGTIKMIELTEQAGLSAPVFESTPHEVIVRLNPTRYVAPTQVRHDLTDLQRELLESLARIGPATLHQLRSHLLNETPERTVQDNLQLLRRLGLVDLSGARRAARWTLADRVRHDIPAEPPGV